MVSNYTDGKSGVDHPAGDSYQGPTCSTCLNLKNFKDELTWFVYVSPAVLWRLATPILSVRVMYIIRAYAQCALRQPHPPKSDGKYKSSNCADECRPVDLNVVTSEVNYSIDVNESMYPYLRVSEIAIGMKGLRTGAFQQSRLDQSKKV